MNINRNKLALVLPDVAWRESYYRYIEELGDEERYPFPMDFANHDFQALLKKIADFATGVNLPDGYVPSTTLWLVADNELLAVANIRHYLNDNLRYAGGHIGLGVRPAARGQALGSYLMQQAISYARGLNINDVHLHCYQSNLASESMIKRCGGVLESSVEVGKGATAQIVQRYVVAKAKSNKAAV